ncbi:MAG TPA: SDR family NAD(P)-dependent oxidoreductase, partial [Acidimicrobiia bacterium]
MADGAVLVVGGTGGIGREIAGHYAKKGAEVIITGRDQERSDSIATDLGEGVRGLAVDLAEPETIEEALSDVGPVSRLVITAVLRDHNPIKEYNISTATDLITMKMVGYSETIHTLIPNFTEDSSVVLYGGLAKERPYPGGLTIATVNGGIATMINDLVVELAPI